MKTMFAEAVSRKSLGLRLFGLSVLIFSYQILLSPTLSTAFAGISLHIILAPAYVAGALALLLTVSLNAIGASRIGGEISTRFSRYGFSAGRISSALPILVLFSVPLAFFLLNHKLTEMNREIGQQAAFFAKPFNIEQVILEVYETYLSTTVLLLALPFFLYGLCLGDFFSGVSSRLTSRLIAIEFSGALVGVIAACIVLDQFGWWAALIGPAVFAGVCLAVTYRTRYRLILLLFLGLLLPCSEKVIPHSDVHISARDFKSKNLVRELRQEWTTYSKVQTLEIMRGDGSLRRLISLGDGTGHAAVPITLAAHPTIPTQISEVFSPQHVLVLFAGAGNELVQMARWQKPPATMTGVELNPHVIEQGALASHGVIAETLARPGVKLVRDEARHFLEHDRGQYDLKCLSG